MHSRIFELKTDKSAENNLTENTVTESDMISCSMDYVTDQSPEDEIESIEWFKQTYPDSVAIDLSEKSFRITDPKKFMQASFRQFKEAIKKLDEATIDDFIGPYLNKDMSKSIGFNLYTLNNAYADNGGFYIYMNSTMVPVNTFIRDFHGDITKQTFYIGNVLDYHF